MKLVVATHNEGKLPEILTILRDALASRADRVELVSAGSLGLPDPVETGVTFEENALLKARDVARRTGLPAVADDSGLIVDVMGRAPGILSARWSGVHGDDKANVRLLLAQLGDIPDGKRTARFCCAAALVVPSAGEGKELDETVCTGEMAGHITRAPRGEYGFGYDPIFVPDEQPANQVTVQADDQFSGDRQANTKAEGQCKEGSDSGVDAPAADDALTSAEMSPEQKNAISHRRKAFTALAPAVGALLSEN